jgi:hypothetical protein
VKKGQTDVLLKQPCESYNSSMTCGRLKGLNGKHTKKCGGPQQLHVYVNGPGGMGLDLCMHVLGRIKGHYVNFIHSCQHIGDSLGIVCTISQFSGPLYGIW